MSRPLASEATMKVDGRCHCGRITYEAMVDPARMSVCHCTDCQRLSGSAFRASIPAPKETFSLLTGAPKIYVKTADSGNQRAHAFCADCGSPIYSSAISDPPTYSLRVGCLTQRGELPPRKQIWCRSALDWAMDLRDVAQVSRQ
jgi:hypothetical protein